MHPGKATLPQNQDCWIPVVSPSFFSGEEVNIQTLSILQADFSIANWDSKGILSETNID